MSATQTNSSWSDAVVRAPQALGLGSPRVAESPPAPVAPVAAPRPVRLPTQVADQEGIYEGLLWAVRALEECGRAFTRLTLRMGKVEARLAAVEQGQGRLAAMEQRLQRLEEGAAERPAAARIVPSGPEPDLAALRRELATAQVRIARLEGTQRKTERSSPLEEHVAALEQDVVGVYRELDGVAQRVDDRLRSAVTAVAELAARLDHMAGGEAGPAEALERRLRAVEARLERAESPRSQAERLHSALGQVLGKSHGAEPAAAPPRSVPASPRAWSDSELARPSLDLAPADLRTRATSVLTAELDRIRSSLGALGAEVPGT